MALRFALAAAVVLCTACCVNPVDPSPVPPPTGPCGARPCLDAGGPVFRDGGETFPGACFIPGFAQPCERECAHSQLTCFRERRTTTDVEHEGGTATLEVVAFPNGLCSTACSVDAECGDCGQCVPYALAGRARLQGIVGGTGVCRPRCFGLECGAGYACDPLVGACLEACTTDEQCRFSTVDTDGDGDDDALAYDAESTLVCASGVCTADAVSIGPACFEGIECPAGFECLRDPERMRTGMCGRVGCSTDESCGPDAACVEREDGTTICTQACTVGAERPEDRIGGTGRGAGCAERFACLHHGPAATDGACLPGTYDDVLEPNVGERCSADWECYSPYGRGRCLRARPDEGEGTCVVEDCIAGQADQLWPGVTVPSPTICDQTAATCLPITATRSRTLCAVTCASASDCLPGWACVALPGGDRACFPGCTVDEDCRSGTTCRADDDTPCDDADRGCVCE
ncbi:hypothetical protein [Sandaracinus amylolyticus]|uniref:Tryptophan synthase alpha chain n=1 Tax=Sandaracinus amylolyticus TaxID=927083 RepID=A0A0F6W2H3_9BACT|nr:hypothetical protein [Sandaracinus amylolyticus]AKF05818.1 Tryptophan synthase alpha chain [Sandaracinus amylolyticus]